MARNYWDSDYAEINTEIHPKYEILYSDLKKHNIQKYLVGREFKILLSKLGAYEQWKGIFERIKKQCRVITLGTDQDPWHAEDTLAVYLNALNDQPEFQYLIVQIISSFISNVSTRKNYSDILESLLMLNFDKQHIAVVEESIEENKLKPEEKKAFQKTKDAKKTYTMDKVFIVHGHDDGLKNEVARLIEKQNIEAIILHEQASGGKTIIEKIESMTDVGFGIILYTPCDVGSKKGSENDLKDRARQNVVFEHGYLIGKIGRKNVAAIVKGNVETPGDVSGVVYISYTGSWKFDLMKELKESGYKIDFNKIQ
ncbi:nucleotide-binding protein [Chryseobacterium sp. 09-1422]|uniref:Nucleotide-binding protein n=1 Tax=Chryseobacterium kimseyorum TaxID=2984028 RepID=A0ABT3I3C2_9FLAO|nr:nucleotide-binding protein [Chryseobacterium kimseyorum]MCW3170348.1 nucleotide-binding protein [Chryseobacterium kimseyorum]